MQLTSTNTPSLFILCCEKCIIKKAIKHGNKYLKLIPLIKTNNISHAKKITAHHLSTLSRKCPFPCIHILFINSKRSIFKYHLSTTLPILLNTLCAIKLLPSCKYQHEGIDFQFGITKLQSNYIIICVTNMSLYILINENNSDIKILIYPLIAEAIS